MFVLQLEARRNWLKIELGRSERKVNSEKLDLPTSQIICLLYHRFVAIEKKNCRFHLDQGIYIANKVTKATKSMTGYKRVKMLMIEMGMYLMVT